MPTPRKTSKPAEDEAAQAEQPIDGGPEIVGNPFAEGTQVTTHELVETGANPNTDPRIANTTPVEEGRPASAAAVHPSVIPAQARVVYDIPDVDRKRVNALLEERAGFVARLAGALGDENRARVQGRIDAVDADLEAFGTSYDDATRDRDERAARVARGLPADPDAPSNHQAMIDALMEERSGYVRRAQNPEAKADMEQRITAVDESLRRLGTTYEEAARARGERTQDRAQQPQGAERSGGQQTR